jgi:hypothetical protein
VSRNAYLVSAGFLAGLILLKFSWDTGFTSLIRFGAPRENARHSSLNSLPIATVYGSNGYDGQFYAQIALDPLLRGPELERVLDAPAYRARRILLPAVASILGIGNPWWTLQIYALLNFACWLTLGWLLMQEVGTGDWRSFARWSACMFSMGVLESVRQSLVDLPALLLLVLALRSHKSSQWLTSSFWLALANLTKETSLLATVALHGEKIICPNHSKRSWFAIALATLPFALWSWYVWSRFRSGTPDSSLGNLSWPFFGVWAQIKLSVHEILSGNLDSRYTMALAAVLGLGLQSAYLWKSRDWHSPWWRIGASFAVLLIFLSPWVWSGYWAVCRAVLPLTVAFNILLPADRWFWPMWTVGNLTLAHGLWRFL